MTSKKKNNDDEPTYAEASGELEAILQEIESGEIDLDELGDKVERAATLLAFCRQRLAATETKVKKVTADLAAAIDADADGDDKGDA
jgi:exodeoxyribonuclease VII small subunit